MYHLAHSSVQVGDRCIQRCALCGHLLRDNYRDSVDPSTGSFFVYEPGTWIWASNMDDGETRYVVMDKFDNKWIHTATGWCRPNELPKDGTSFVCSELARTGKKQA